MSAYKHRASDPDIYRSPPPLGEGPRAWLCLLLLIGSMYMGCAIFIIKPALFLVMPILAWGYLPALLFNWAPENPMHLGAPILAVILALGTLIARLSWGWLTACTTLCGACTGGLAFFAFIQILLGEMP